MTLAICIACLVGIGVAAYLGVNHASTTKLSHHAWGIIGGILLAAVFFAGAVSPDNPVPALLLGIPFVFCAAVGIYSQPDPVGA